MCALHAVMLSGMFALSCVPEQVDISKSFEHPVQTDMRRTFQIAFSFLYGMQVDISNSFEVRCVEGTDDIDEPFLQKKMEQCELQFAYVLCT